MESEDHPYPEGAIVRFGLPALATALLAGTVVVVLTMPAGQGRTLTLALAVVLQLVVLVPRAVATRRRARPTDWTVRWHQFAFMWGAMTAVDALMNGDRRTDAALAGIGQQLFVAVFVVAVVWLSDGTAARWWPRRRRPTSDDTG